MNLATRDLAHQWRRFVATALGLGLLFTVVLAMGGIYEGMVVEATSLVERTGADLWVVQRRTRGPFAERSVVPKLLELRARAMPGVRWARAFTTITVQPQHRGRTLRLTLVGLDFPSERGASLPLVAGRAVERAHRELVVDRSLGLALGESIALGDDTYTVVGLGQGLVASGGDPLGFVTENDLERIQGYLAPAARRAMRLAHGATAAEGSSAILVAAETPAELAELRVRLARWDDVSVYTTAEQRSFLLEGVVDKARRQIGLFRSLLALVSAIVVSLVVFNMTIAKTHEIALLKLMGARLTLVVGMIVQQAVLLAVLGFGVAAGLSVVAFPHFPRRVIVGPEDLWSGLGVAVLLSLVASLAAVKRALSIPPTTILAG